MRSSLSIAAAALLLVMAAPAGAAGDPFVAFDSSIVATKAAMMGDPREALRHAEAALRLADTLPQSRRSQVARATAQWLVAEALIYTNEPGRAGPQVEQAIATISRVAPTSKLSGDLMRSRGAIAAIGGHVQEALGDFQRAYEIFRKAGEARSQAIALQDIGEIYLDAGDYDRVLQYYSQSAETFDDDPALRLTTHNNLAEVYRQKRQFAKAVAEYRAGLADARKIQSPILQTRILTNLAAAQIDAGQIAGADRSVAEAMRMSASGEAQGWQPFVYGVAAKAAAAGGDYARAATMLERTFGNDDLTRTAMPYREFHELAANVYEKRGDRAAALAHLRAFQRLDREARNLTASTSAQLLAAKFDFTNQNLKISKLKQGQLQRDIEIERQSSHFRTVLLTGLLAGAGIVFALLLTGYFSLRRSRNEVRAANANLTDINTRLEKALLARTEFLATTSHEIRTPLNGILGMTQVLLADRGLDPDVRSKVAVAHGAGEVMKALVDDILDVAKMENGEVSVAREPTDLRRILDDAMQLWGGQAEVKGLSLRLDAPDLPRRILADDARLRQIVFNLMSNAIKFTPAGSVVLSATAEQIDAREELVIRVVDTGIGIAPALHEIVFEAFKQVDGGTTRQFGGTGLGLAICRRLVTAMNGTIGVRSDGDAGAAFTVRLPLERVADQPAADGKTGPGVASTLAGAHLLLIERNMLQQSILRALLSPSVATIDVVGSGVDALAALERGTIGHVLADAGSIVPEGGNILAAIRDLAATARTMGVPCSILVTPGDLLRVADIVPLGVTQVIEKPISGAGLIAMLGQVYATEDIPREPARLHAAM